MTTPVKDLLDDAAADAVAGLRIDLNAVAARADRRRWRLRSVGTVLMVAAAAVLTIGLAVPAVLVAQVRPAVSPVGAVGLPTTWHPGSTDLPVVTEARMYAASMLLGGNGEDPVLVSSDARTYARLPWAPGDAMATLAPAGTRIAWASQSPDRSMVHVLRIADGRRVDARLPSGSGWVQQLLWVGGQIYATTGGTVVRIDGTSGAVRALCVCGSTELGVDAAGTVVAPSGAGVTGAREVPYVPPVDAYPVPDAPSWARTNSSADFPSWGYTTSPQLAVAPDGLLAAGLSWAPAPEGGGTGWQINLANVDPAQLDPVVPIEDPRQVVDAEILTWAPAGILVRVDTLADGLRDSSLRLVDPVTHEASTVSVGQSVPDVPLAVASGLVGDGLSIASPAPRVTSQARATYLGLRFWRANYPYRQLLTLAALSATAALAILRRRRRSRRE